MEWYLSGLPPPRRRFRFVVAALAAVILSPISTASAASDLSCGQVLRTNTRLEADLFCPSGSGLVVEGNGVSLNLNGHAIRGELETRLVTQTGATGDNGVVGSPYTVRFAKGQFAGVTVRGSGNAVVGPGTISGFAGGVVVEGGGSNTLTRLTVSGNIGPAGTQDLGDGIMISDSSDNRVIANTVRDNGPFSGIVLLGASNRNVVSGNVVTENRQPEVCPDRDVFVFSVSGGGVVLFCGPSHPTFKPFTFVMQQDHGIKFEQGADGRAAHQNTVVDNVASQNGNSGIFLTTTCPDLGATDTQCPGEPHSDNLIKGNQANGNGFGVPTGLPARRVFEGANNGGSGIVIMIGGPKPAIRQTVYGNTTNDNAANGIVVLPHRPGSGVTQTKFIRNTALRNNANPVPGGFSNFNGYDGNASITPAIPCDGNTWQDNNFGSASADIGGPVPPNNLTNHECVGPRLVAPTQVAASALDDASSPSYLSRRRPEATPGRRGR